MLLDWHLADGCAGGFLEALAAQHPHLVARTAIITGDVLDSRDREIEGRPVLRKPFRPAELIELVERIRDPDRH